MSRVSRFGVVLALLLLYVGGFHACSDVYKTSVAGSPVSIRVFSSKWQVRLWMPLLYGEGMIRREEYHWQTASGASMPQPDE